MELADLKVYDLSIGNVNAYFDLGTAQIQYFVLFSHGSYYKALHHPEKILEFIEKNNPSYLEYINKFLEFA